MYLADVTMHSVVSAGRLLGLPRLSARARRKGVHRVPCCSSDQPESGNTVQLLNRRSVFAGLGLIALTSLTGAADAKDQAQKLSAYEEMIQLTGKPDTSKLLEKYEKTKQAEAVRKQGANSKQTGNSAVSGSGNNSVLLGLGALGVVGLAIASSAGAKKEGSSVQKSSPTTRQTVTKPSISSGTRVVRQPPTGSKAVSKPAAGTRVLGKPNLAQPQRISRPDMGTRLLRKPAAKLAGTKAVVKPSPGTRVASKPAPRARAAPQKGSSKRGAAPAPASRGEPSSAGPLAGLAVVTLGAVALLVGGTSSLNPTQTTTSQDEGTVAQVEATGPLPPPPAPTPAPAPAPSPAPAPTTPDVPRTPEGPPPPPADMPRSGMPLAPPPTQENKPRTLPSPDNVPAPPCRDCDDGLATQSGKADTQPPKATAPTQDSLEGADAAGGEEAPDKALLLGGGIVVVLAAAALAGSTEQSWEGAATSDQTVPSPTSPGMDDVGQQTPEADAAKRKAEAQAWIAAWRAKQQK